MTTSVAALAMTILAWQSPGAQPASAPQVEVLLVRGNDRAPLTPQAPRARSHNLQIAIFGFSSDVWAVDGVKSAVRIKASTPTFEVRLPDGMNAADEVWLVRLKTRDGSREIGREHDTATGLNDKDRLALIVEPAPEVESPGQRRYRVTPRAPLKSGEYMLVIQGRFFDFAVD